MIPDFSFSLFFLVSSRPLTFFTTRYHTLFPFLYHLASWKGSPHSFSLIHLSFLAPGSLLLPPPALHWNHSFKDHQCPNCRFIASFRSSLYLTFLAINTVICFLFLKTSLVFQKFLVSLFSSSLLLLHQFLH